MKKVLSIVLSLVMVLCMVPTMAFADTAVYSDIEGEKCEASVELLTELGVVEGYGDGTYQPGEVVTRAEMAKLIVTALGLNPTSSTTSFTDMDAAKWAIPHVGYAESLGIIKGYGDGRFGPNDTVTYDEVVTMIVRAIGYTEACNEMQGQWPAVFVQKANELGILKNIATTGDAGANRGDVAIMLANALYVQMVYADNEGATVPRNDADGAEVTMYSTLVKEGGKYYGVVDESDIENATKNVTDLLGAAGQIVYNEDGDVISVSDIKSTFMTGKFNATGTTFTVDGVAYKVSEDSLKKLDGKGKAVQYTVEDAGYGYTIDYWAQVPVFKNAETSGSAIDAEVYKASEIVNRVGADKTVTIACLTNGKTITAIFSVQAWNLSTDLKVDEADLAQIEANHKLLGFEFTTDNEKEIDETSFLLLGVDSLDDIEADDIVYVYADSDKKITKIEVSNETVTGVISKINGAKYTIDGEVYEVVGDAVMNEDIGDCNAGDEVTIGLDYAGNIYTLKLTDASAGNYAVIVDISSTDPAAVTDVEGSAKIQLLTADGVIVYNVGSKYASNVDKGKSTAWSDLAQGDIVKFAVNDSSVVTDIDEMTTSLKDDSSKLKITANGYIDGVAIADNATIFAVPVDSGAFDYSDKDELTVVSKDIILSTDADLLTTVVDSKTGKIVAMIISASSTSKDEYGIATSVYAIPNSKTGVDFYIGTDKTTDAVVNGTEPDVASADDQITMLYKIKKTTTGEYTFDPVDASLRTTDKGINVTIKSGAVTVKGKTLNLANDLVVYVYDVSDKAYSIGARADLIDDEALEVAVYQNNDSKDANYKLVDYAVVYRP